jgi:predicted GIY-YIG superfamily endonuclease
MELTEIEAIAALGIWYERFKPYEREMPSLGRVFYLLDELGIGKVLPGHDQYVVYALVDPRSQDICYIGITNHPERRMNQHINGEDNLRKQAWLQSLRTHGLRPTMKILETVTGQKEARRREEQWIAACEHVGIDLLNYQQPNRVEQASLLPASPSSSHATASTTRASRTAQLKPRVTEAERAEILAWHQAGWAASAIASKMGKSSNFYYVIREVLEEASAQQPENT